MKHEEVLKAAMGFFCDSCTQSDKNNDLCEQCQVKGWYKTMINYFEEYRNAIVDSAPKIEKCDCMCNDCKQTVNDFHEWKKQTKGA